MLLDTHAIGRLALHEEGAGEAGARLAEHRDARVRAFVGRSVRRVASSIPLLGATRAVAPLATGAVLEFWEEGLVVLERLLVKRTCARVARAALEAPSEREVRGGLGAMAFVVRSARVVDQKLAEARARLRRVEPEERLRVGLVGRGPAEGGGRRGEQYESRYFLVAEGPRTHDHYEDAEEDRVEN